MQTDSVFWAQVVPLVLTFFVFYCLVIRPGRLAERARWDAVQALKGGEWVVTKAGVVARVAGVFVEAVELEVADGVRVLVLEDGIREVLRGPVGRTDPAALAAGKDASADGGDAQAAESEGAGT